MSVRSISGTVREHGVSDRAECGVGVSVVDEDGDGVRVLSLKSPSTQFIGGLYKSVDLYVFFPFSFWRFPSAPLICSSRTDTSSVPTPRSIIYLL